MNGFIYNALIPYTESSTSNPWKHYVKRITIPYDSEKMNSDFSDIRFTNEDESLELYHALVEKIDEDYAIFDVNIPSLSPSSESNIKLHCGNPSAISASDIVNTYLIYDTFEDGQFTQRDSQVLSNDPNCYEAWPSITKLSDGTLLVSYRKADSNVHTYEPTGRIVLKTSTDNGFNWSDETVIVDIPNIDCRNGGMVVFDDNGTETAVRFFDALDSDGVFSVYYAKSIDGCVTWSDPVFIVSNKSCGCSPIQLSNGDIVVVLANTNNTATYLYRSSDFCQSWSNTLIISGYYNETSLVEIKTNGVFSGGLIAISRSNDLYLHKIVSSDYGYTWGSQTTLTQFALTLATRAMCTRLNDEMIAIVYPYTHIYMSISYDEGLNWHNQSIYQIPPGASPYPDVVPIDHGHSVVAFCSNLSNSSDIYIKRVSHGKYDWANNGTVGTLSLESVSPIDGSYSLKHVGGAVTGQCNNYSYGALIPISATGKKKFEFDIQLYSQGSQGSTPFVQLWYLSMNGCNNLLALTTYYASPNQYLRLTKIVNGTASTYGTVSWFSGKWPVGQKHHFKIIDSGDHAIVYVDDVKLIDVDYVFTRSNLSHTGFHSSNDSAVLFDNLISTPYVNPEPEIGEIGEYTGPYLITDVGGLNYDFIFGCGI